MISPFTWFSALPSTLSVLLDILTPPLLRFASFAAFCHFLHRRLRRTWTFPPRIRVTPRFPRFACISPAGLQFSFESALWFYTPFVHVVSLLHTTTQQRRVDALGPFLPLFCTPLLPRLAARFELRTLSRDAAYRGFADACTLITAAHHFLRIYTPRRVYTLHMHSTLPHAAHLSSLLDFLRTWFWFAYAVWFATLTHCCAFRFLPFATRAVTHGSYTHNAPRTAPLAHALTSRTHWFLCLSYLLIGSPTMPHGLHQHTVLHAFTHIRNLSHTSVCYHNSGHSSAHWTATAPAHLRACTLTSRSHAPQPLLSRTVLFCMDLRFAYRVLPLPRVRCSFLGGLYTRILSSMIVTRIVLHLLPHSAATRLLLLPAHAFYRTLFLSVARRFLMLDFRPLRPARTDDTCVSLVRLLVTPGLVLR